MDDRVEGGNRHVVEWIMDQMGYAFPGAFIGSTVTAYVFDLSLVDWVLLVPLMTWIMILLLGAETLFKRRFSNVS